MAPEETALIMSPSRASSFSVRPRSRLRSISRPRSFLASHDPDDVSQVFTAFSPWGIEHSRAAGLDPFVPVVAAGG